MFRAKLHLITVSLSLVVLLAGASTSQPGPTTDLEIGDAAAARDAAVTYLREQEAQNAPSSDILWQEYITTPEGLIGTETREFLSGEWKVTVSYPLVLPENTVYDVIVFNTEGGWHWKGIIKGDGTITELSAFRQITEEENRKIAEEFLRNSPTFIFDGMADTLRLTDTIETPSAYSWAFMFEFDSSQAGYGDRTGRMLAEVITPHRAVVTVEQLEVISAVMDEKWDMISQEELLSSVEPGSVAIEGETDFTGWITDIQRIYRGGTLGQILVESQVDKLIDKYMITVKDETLIFLQFGEKRSRIAFADLETGQQAQIWFSGPVMESFPAQVDAKQIVIVDKYGDDNLEE